MRRSRPAAPRGARNSCGRPPSYMPVEAFCVDRRGRGRRDRRRQPHHRDRAGPRRDGDVEPIAHGQAPDPGSEGLSRIAARARRLCCTGWRSRRTPPSTSWCWRRCGRWTRRRRRFRPPSSPRSPVRSLRRPDARTPAGTGSAVGRHVPLDDLGADVIAGPAIVSVDAATDFEVAAEQVTRGARARLADRGCARRAGRCGADPQPHTRRRAGGRRGRSGGARTGSAGRRGGGRRRAAPTVRWPTRSRCLRLCSSGTRQIRDVAEFTRELADSPAIAVTVRTEPPEPPAPDDDYVDCVVGRQGGAIHARAGAERPAVATAGQRAAGSASRHCDRRRTNSPSTTCSSPIWRRSTTGHGCGGGSRRRTAPSSRFSPPTTSLTLRRP